MSGASSRTRFPDLSRISHAIFAERSRKGLTQQKLADMSGLSLNTVKQIERNVGRRTRMETLVRIAVALDISIDNLIYGTWNGQDELARRLERCYLGLSAPGRSALVGIAQELVRLEREFAKEGFDSVSGR